MWCSSPTRLSSCLCRAEPGADIKMGHPDTPLFVKTHDFNLWLFQHTGRFPKHLRHTYTNRLESLALDFEKTESGPPNMKPFLALLVGILAFSCTAQAADKPNILWLTSEDHGPQLGCYGDANARTPNVDVLAAKGMLFKRAWSVAPVCAPARTAIITGLYTSSSGGQHMRSMVPLPAEMKMYPQFLREAGYYCTNNAKEDYNVRKPAGLWDESSARAHWRKHAAGQPFFAIFNSLKSHESQIRTRPHRQIAEPARMHVPAYHPDTPEVRQDWAQYYDKVSEADADAGKRLTEIEEAGLAEDTIVFYFSDHGSGMPRSKRWPCNSGLHVPLVVYFPQKWEHLAPREYQPGGKSDRLLSFVDLAPTLLSIAGIKPPEWMEGHAFAGPYQSDPQPYLLGERGRMDECMDLVRSVTDGRYVYLRNYFPHVSQGQFVTYQFETPTTRIWRELFDQGKATEAQSIFWRVPKASEELYDLQSDPDEVRISQARQNTAAFWKSSATPSENIWSEFAMCVSSRKANSIPAPKGVRLIKWREMRRRIPRRASSPRRNLPRTSTPAHCLS